MELKPCEDGDRIGNLENAVMEHGTVRTSGWNPESHEEEDGTQNPENKGMELRSLSNGIRNLENRVMEHRTSRTRGQNSKSREQEDGTVNSDNKGIEFKT